MGLDLNNTKNYSTKHNEEIERANVFSFFVFLAPYDVNTGEIGAIKLYSVKSNKKVIDFIKETFPSNKRKITHVYNVNDSREIDKYSLFSSIIRRHSIIELVYFYEDKNYNETKTINIREFGIFELRDKYNSQIDLLLKNVKDKRVFTKEFSVDYSNTIDDFIKSNFNTDLIIFIKGKILNQEKSFIDNGLYKSLNFLSEEKKELYYVEKNNDNLTENGYSIGNYVILGKISTGKYGHIYKAININNLKEYAIKEIKLLSNITEGATNSLNLLKKLNHKYLVKYQEIIKENNYYYIIMELCSNNNFYNLIKEIKNKHQILNENFIWEIFIKICIGVGYLNKNYMIHGNLNTSNIFIENNGNIKIGDYGISKLFDSSEKNDENIDIYDLGCILNEICELDFLPAYENIITYKERIYKSDLNKYSENMKKTIKQLIESNKNFKNGIQDFLVQDYIIKITEKVGLLPELYELYPSYVKNLENNIINHIYNNILKRNNILDDSVFDLNWNKDSTSWKKSKEKLGNYPLYYYPPNGWIGIGLNINKYGEDKTWLNKVNGWATAYHGLRLCEMKDKKYNIVNCNEFDLNRKLELTIKSIIENGFKDGINQPLKYERNIFTFSRNKFKYCEEGIYLSFQVEEAKKYSIPISGYNFVLMCKVCPTEIRECRRFKGEFVADGNYVRPYRILSKKSNEI